MPTTTSQKMSNAADDINPSYSSLVALSAQNSLKRSRILYATNPQSAFLPSTDPVILQNSMNRRYSKRRVVATKEQNTTNSNALAIVNNEQDELQMKPISATTTQGVSGGSTALTFHGNSMEADNNNKKKTSGILVVSTRERKYVTHSFFLRF
jgi:hypothetical protein